MDYSRIMAIDYGEVRIGIAMTDLLKIIASPYETYTRKSLDIDLAYLANLIEKNNCKIVVLGLPLNMDGSEGDRALKTREFASKLKNFISDDIKICFQDERLSSVEAEDVLIQVGVRRENRKKVIDKIAACIILESYLNSNKI